MPIVTVPEVVWITPLRTVDPPPWTTQPDGSQLFVGSLMEPSEEATESVSLVQREAIEFNRSVPTIQPRRLRPYQVECVDAVFAAWNAGHKSPLIVLATGCHRAGQHVLMADGSSRAVEDIRVGDQLLGPGGGARNVTALCRGEDEMYEIRPVKGSSWFVNRDHILTLVKTNRRASESESESETKDVSVGEWLSWNDHQKHLWKLFRSGAVERFPARADECLPIDPYFVGVLLGDGTLWKSAVEVSKPDPEIRDECERQADLWGLNFRNKEMRAGRCPIWTLTSDGTRPNRLLDAMRDLGLTNVSCRDRTVPERYLYANRSSRMELLAGLLDTDGHQESGKSGFEFSSASKKLADQVAFISRSLGFYASVACRNKRCQTGAVGAYYIVLVNGDGVDQIPLRLERKRSPPRRQKKNVLRSGFKVVPTGTREPFYGFVLDGDHRYLLDDFTVTHNSGKTVVAAEVVRRFRAEHPGFGHRVWFLAHRKKLLDQSYRTIKMIDPEATCGIVQGSRRDVGKNVTIASVDTLANRGRFDHALTGSNDQLRGLRASPPALVILDECHHATSPKWQRVISWIKEASPNCVFLGLTATPGRTDGTSLDSVFDCVAYQRNIFQLLEDGYLVPPVGFKVNLHVDLRVIPTENGDFKKAPLSKVMNQPDVRKAVVDGYLRLGNDRKMLAFCVDVAHAKDLAETFRSHGVQARHVDGSMKEPDVEATLQAFSEGKTRILTSCDILTEGYDDPSAQGVIFARPTQSQLVYVQAIGRALRLHPSKQDALILDCVGSSDEYKLAQLATLAGLNSIEKGKGKLGGAPEDVEITQAHVGGIDATRIDFNIVRARASKWSWRETRFGWMVQIPRVGYFLLAWSKNDRSVVDIKFHDMRDGRRDSPPSIIATQMDFDMAYGLVEAEIDRLFSARTSRARINEDESSDPMEAMRDAVAQGISGELFSPEELMKKDAGWRDKPTTERQRRALLDVGVKPESVPATAGEATDLYSVLLVERNAKMREPATEKQKKLIVSRKLATHDEAERMTKKQAAGIIVAFLKQKEADRRDRQAEEEASARFDEADESLFDGADE